MFNVTVAAKFSTHTKNQINEIIAYASTFLRPNVCEKNSPIVSVKY